MRRRKKTAFVVGFPVLLTAGLLFVPAARAQVTGSATLVSDYRFRGVSLSDGDPAAQLDLNYDHPAGWYSGVFVSNTRLGVPPQTQIQWLPYAGFAAHLKSGASIDLGATYSGFTGGNELGYFEANAGITIDEFRFRLSYSPDYFQSGARTLYVQIDASRALGDRLRVFAHLGDLQLLTEPPGDSDAAQHQLDVRSGLAAHWSQLTVSLSWVSANRVAAVYPVQNYEGNVNGAHSVWVVQLTWSF